MEITYKKNILGNFNLINNNGEILKNSNVIGILGFEGSESLVRLYGATMIESYYGYFFSFSKEKNARKAAQYLNNKILMNTLIQGY